MGILFKRHTKEQKAKLCKEWSASGLSQSEFCRQKDLKIATFSTWLKKLAVTKKTKGVEAPRRKAKKAASFIPLSLSDNSGRSKEESNEPEAKCFKITLLDKIVISLPANTSDLLVLKILDGLVQCI